MIYSFSLSLSLSLSLVEGLGALEQPHLQGWCGWGGALGKGAEAV